MAVLLAIVLLQSACAPNVTNTYAPTGEPTQEAAKNKPVLYQVSPDTSSLMMCYIIKTQKSQ